MIREFSTRVKATNNNAKITFFILLGVAAALTATYIFIPVYKSIVGVVDMVAIVAAVAIYSKYVSASYFYDITFDYHGEPLFVVRQVTGRRQTTLARVGLREIREIKMETAEERKAHKTPQGFRKYVYTPTLGPTLTCRLTAKSAYESSEVIIECTPEFAEMLSSYVEDAKVNDYSDYAEDEDE